MTAPQDVNVDRIVEGQKHAVAAALNLMENRRVEYGGLIRDLVEKLSRAVRSRRHVIGVTGPPGVGKSSLIGRFIAEYRRRGKTVAVLSVDPSSRRTGGALLGDRARISYDPRDNGVFIRSMSAGRHLGGLAFRTRFCLTVFEAAYDVILVETVGVGQSETEIDSVAETVLFVVQPGSGDVIQFIKAGVMEIPHILVVNKADHGALAARTARDLAVAKGYSASVLAGWELEIIMTSALEGRGYEAVVDRLDAHRRFLEDRELLEPKRRSNRIQWIAMLVREQFGQWGMDRLGGEEKLLEIADGMGNMSPLGTFADLSDMILADEETRIGAGQARCP